MSAELVEESVATATVVPRRRRTKVDKHQQRRDQLAESALVTLGELGYARTSLREIAANSPFSHGVVHYYFRDKFELIVYCVRFHKSTCVLRYDDVIEAADSAQGLIDGFVAKLRETLVEDAPMHRLWYDLRTASMFEEPLRETVALIDGWLQDMVWRVVTRYASLADRGIAVPPATAYAIVDGLFQQALLGMHDHASEAVDRIEASIRDLLPTLLLPA
ncbi:TetR/AcrR family transcriptional regulator [Nocardioides sp. BP30]|uniref:TetR/AcrR family transcriptional regulator n=1 Tax=Nocardioides sp. BP30 TaxID=3036374 RepID=UPI00246912D0|nr:TetR/AcrR family transcriptional regulator [Nocardioides sp. BP30]WGL51157.1 TetR/AcrR family transcriptional regulator [Nocardioides sp. BP30]